MNWEDVIVDASATDTGMRRTNNQDSFAIVRGSTRESWRLRGHLFMVADGMGAHAAGELASKMACDNIPHNYRKTKTGTPAENLIRAYREVGAQIHAKAVANKDFQGMGTTCSTLVLLPAGALIAHVGDSRVYRIREGRIDQLTFDHSLVWELVRRKHLSPDQAAGKNVPRNVITRSLGPEPTVEVDIEGPVPVEPGDVFLLCSDGLSGPVTDDEIGAFGGNFHPERASRYLVQLANLRGGQDNITVVICRVGEWVEPTPDGEAAAGSDDGKANKRNRGSLLSSLIGSLKGKPAPAVEETVYQSFECRVDLPLVGRMADVLRTAQSLGLEQAWPADWSALAAHRKKAEEFRRVGDLRAALGQLGEAIEVLGHAGRVHRKEKGSIGAS